MMYIWKNVILVPLTVIPDTVCSWILHIIGRTVIHKYTTLCYNNMRDYKTLELCISVTVWVIGKQWEICFHPDVLMSGAALNALSESHTDEAAGF